MLTRHFKVVLMGHGRDDDKRITPESIQQFLSEHFRESMVDVIETKSVKDL